MTELLRPLILYPLICVALYYLGARAQITRWAWSRYPAWLDKLTLCPACSGFWYGLACGAAGAALQWPFLGLDGRDPVAIVAVGLCAIVWTPVIAWAHIYTMEALNPPAAVDDDGAEAEPERTTVASD